MYRSNLRIAAGALLACGSAWASVPPSTGQGGGTLDSNYQIAAPDGSTRPAFIIGKLSQWDTPDSGAKWIGPDPKAFSSYAHDGNVIYVLRFTVTDLSKASLIMSVLCDPDADVVLNSTSITPQSTSAKNPPAKRTLDSAHGLVQGQNTLLFYVSDFGAGANTSALNVSFSGSLGDATTPPSTSTYCDPSAPFCPGPPARYGAVSVQDPVDSATGQFYEQILDLDLGGPLGTRFARYYSSTLSGGGYKARLA